MKDAAAPADKYVDALAGSGIQTNPPATNDAVQRLNKTYVRNIDEMPARSVLGEIAKVDTTALEGVLLNEGTRKFAEAQKALLRRIAAKRALFPTAPAESTKITGVTAGPHE